MCRMQAIFAPLISPARADGDAGPQVFAVLASAPMRHTADHAHARGQAIAAISGVHRQHRTAKADRRAGTGDLDTAASPAWPRRAWPLSRLERVHRRGGLRRAALDRKSVV